MRYDATRCVRQEANMLRRLTRFFGTLIGLNINYAWAWYAWREAHEYFMSPLAVFLWGTTTICDLIYPVVFTYIRRSERVLADGRKIAGGSNGKRDA